MNSIPASQVSRLGIHFSFIKPEILPDNLYCDVISKGYRIKRASGEIIFSARNVQISTFLVGALMNNLKNVSCSGQWIQDRFDSEQDFFRAHFVFVQEQQRDNFLAMRHNQEVAEQSLKYLVGYSWDVTLWQNQVGVFDLFCTQPSKKVTNVLLFDQESLRCVG
jgi:hypothetical protein